MDIVQLHKPADSSPPSAADGVPAPVHACSYTAERRAAWDAFVAASPESSFGHLSANFALAAADRRVANRTLLLSDSSGRLLGILPLFEVAQRELRIVPVRTLLSGLHFPAGPLFAPHVNRKWRERLTAQLVRRVEDLATILSVDRVAIAYPNVIDGRPAIRHFGHLPLRAYGFRETNVVSLLLDLNETEASLKSRLRERARRALRRALEAGLVVAPLGARERWLECHPLNVECLGPLAWSRAQMELIWDVFVAAGHASVFAAAIGNAIASVVVVLHHGKSSYYWIGLNRRPAIPGANHLALWQAVLERRRAGDRLFELGSKDFGDRKQADISHFKESFGGESVYALGGARELKPIKRALLDLAHRAAASARTRHDVRREPHC